MKSLRNSLYLILVFLLFPDYSFAQLEFPPDLIGQKVEITYKNGKKMEGTVSEISDSLIILYKNKEYISIRKFAILSYKITDTKELSENDFDYYYFCTPSAFSLQKKELRTRGPFLAASIWDYGISNKLTWHFGTVIGIVYGTGFSFRQPLGKNHGLVFSASSFISLPGMFGSALGRFGYSFRFGKSDLTLGYTFATDFLDFVHLPSISYRFKLNKKDYFIYESLPLFFYGSFVYIQNISFRVATRNENYWHYGIATMTSEYSSSKSGFITFPFPTIGYHCALRKKK